jgi:hypothetical protein
MNLRDNAVRKRRPWQIGRRWSRASVAVAVSGLLHLGLLLLLLPGRRPLTGIPTAVELEVVEAPPPSEETPARERARAGGVERQRPPTRPRSPSRTPSPAPSPGPARASGALGMRRLDLTPTADQLDRAGLEVAPAFGPAPGRPGWSARLEALEREDRALAELQVRRAPPIAYDILRGADRLFAPSRELVLALARAEAGREHGADRWLGRYLGGFLDRDRPATGGQAGRRDEMAGFNRAMKAAPIRYAARVCVTLHPQRSPVVQLTRSSGLARLDDLAVRVTTDAATHAPARDPPVSSRPCYRFTATLTRVPPLIHAIAVGQWPFQELADTRIDLDGLERPDANALAIP